MKRSQVCRMIATAALLASTAAGAGELSQRLPAAAATAGAEVRSQPEEEPASKAQGNNRGYVVGKGGVARLRDGSPDTDGDGGSAAPDGNGATQMVAAPIGVNEPGVNRAPKGENDPGLSLRTRRKQSEGGD